MFEEVVSIIRVSFFPFSQKHSHRQRGGWSIDDNGGGAVVETEVVHTTQK